MLQQRLEKYEVKVNSDQPLKYGKLAVTIRLLNSDSLLQFKESLSEKQEDPFSLKGFAAASLLAEKLWSLLPIESIEIYEQKLVLIFSRNFALNLLNSVVKLTTLITEQLISLGISEPKFLIAPSFLPLKEVLHFRRMHKMYYVAKRNRILGEIYCGVPRTDKNYAHKDLLLEAIKMPIFIKYETVEQGLSDLYSSAIISGLQYNAEGISCLNLE